MGKNTIKEVLAAGLADAPFSLIKRVDSYESFTIQVVYDTGTVASTGALYSSSDYDPETGAGEWNLVQDTAASWTSQQTFDEVNGGVHTWAVREFLEPYLKIVFTGDVQALEVVFIGQPKGSRLANI